MSENIDCGDCPNITDGCRGLCEKIDLGVSRWSANWHMQEYYQSKHGDYVSAADYAAAQSQLAALREELAQAASMRTFWAESAAELDKRLADAERRNAEQLQELVRARSLIEQAGNFRASTFSDCSGLILSLQAFVAETKSAGEYVAVRRDLLNLVCHGYVQEQGHALNRLRDQIAALNPNPEAASHDVCSACGGDSFVPYAEYHSHDE